MDRVHTSTEQDGATPPWVGLPGDAATPHRTTAKGSAGGLVRPFGMGLLTDVGERPLPKAGDSPEETVRPFGTTYETSSDYPGRVDVDTGFAKD